MPKSALPTTGCDEVSNDSADVYSTFEALIGEVSVKFTAASGNLDRRIDDAIRVLGEYLDTDRVTFLEVDPVKRRLVPTRQWLADGIQNIDVVLDSEVSTIFPWLASKIFAGEPIVIDDLDQFPEEARDERRHCEEMGIRSFTMIPVELGGVIYGALALDSIRRSRIWDEPTLRRLVVVATIIVNARDRAIKERALEDARLFQEATSKISTKFVNLPPESVDSEIEDALQTIALALDVDLITLIRPEGESGHAVTHEWAVETFGDVQFKGANVKDEYPWLAEQLRKDSTVTISRLDDFPQEAANERAAMERAGLESVLWVPFKVRGKLAGYLAVNTMRQRTWGEELLPELRILGEVFGEAQIRRDAEIALKNSYQEIEALKEKLEQENLYLRNEAKVEHRPGNIVGDSDALRAALKKVEQVAATDSTVLILGETGTGKELLARAIHGSSSRRNNILVTINCAALPSSLVEAELFGREKGAYTGALTREPGRFEIADGSTILLDEIGELSLELQAKLLRVLQDGEFERLGSSRTLKVDVRVLAATNRDLGKAVEEKEFREDLYYRLNVFPIDIPPLRDRIEDIPQLVWAFVEEFAESMGKTIETIPRAAMQALQAYPWPGNVREVRNVVERAMIVSAGPTLDIEVPHTAGSSTAMSSKRLSDVERNHIRTVLDATHWRIRGTGGASEILGVKPTTLEARMKKLGLERPH